MTAPTTYRDAVAAFIASGEHGWAGLPFFAGKAQALAERLDQRRRGGAVICPPPDVDPEIKAPTPPGGAMPVIPPPGSPGGDQSVQPK